MNSWLERKARRMLMAGALAFAVGAPTLACMGGETTEEGGEVDGFDPQAKLIGQWKVKPPPEDLRQLQIVDLALKPNSNVQALKKRLSPGPTDAEIALFEDVKRKGVSDPGVAFLAGFIAMLKGAVLTVDESKWTYQIGSERNEMSWTVDEKDGQTMKVTLTSGNGVEKHTLTFEDDNTVDVQITSPEALNLEFKRK